MKSEKRFIVRKYVMARSAKDAIRKERATEAHDVWLDENWMNFAKDREIKGF